MAHILRDENQDKNLSNRVVCPNFGHPALTPSFTKYQFLQVKNRFATLVNELSVLKLFQLSNGDLLFLKNDYSLYNARKPRMTKLGQGVGVRAYYPIVYIYSPVGAIQTATSMCTLGL